MESLAGFGLCGEKFGDLATLSVWVRLSFVSEKVIGHHRSSLHVSVLGRTANHPERDPSPGYPSLNSDRQDA